MNFTLDFDLRVPEELTKLIERIQKFSKETADRIKEDIKSIRARDPAARSDAEVLLLYPGLHAVILYRVAHYFHEKRAYFVARALSQTARTLTGIEIHPAATIGRTLFIDHGSAVVIGETTVIGDNCTIYQGVTLGGTGKDAGKRHPTIGSNTMIGAGAKVLGPIKVGDNAKIAAGAVVLKDVPDGCTAVGIPARIVGTEKNCCETILDQINVPDPVNNEIVLLKQKIKELEDRINGLSQK